MKSIICTLAGISVFMMAGCNLNKTATEDIIAENITHAVSQYSLMTNQIEASGSILNPRTLDEKKQVVYVPYDDWTSGFFPGSMWYMYQLTGDEKWEKLAVKYTEALDSVQYLTWHHDVGFMVGCSYLNGIRMGHKDYASVVLQTARSTRFRPEAGVIQSWDADRGWQAQRGWKCPVIIDNMMNLELLFEATRLSGDSTYYNIAVSHADQTLKNHFRSDGSCYHVVDYDPETGAVRSRQTAQGYADESAWARGQAWAIYGYTVCYRYTRKPEYWEQACKIYDFIFTSKHLPSDLIPYWDYDAPVTKETPRDVSAASVTASAMIELSTMVPDGQKYLDYAEKILKSLSSDAYLAKVGDNQGFILMHSVGSLPNGSEIDTPLNYADYYYLEALKRFMDLKGINYKDI